MTSFEFGREQEVASDLREQAHLKLARWVKYRGLVWIVCTSLAVLESDRVEAEEASFHFCALGDMPYNLPEDYARFDNVIGAINAESPAFTVHVGDTKAGASPCSDDFLQRTWESFAEFDHPLIYTPGDNEWTDCHKTAADSMDPLERLGEIRKRFFSTRYTLGGGKPIPLEVQSDDRKWKAFPENRMWTMESVVFATLHVVGSNNNNQSGVPGAFEEFRMRDKANEAWLERVFAAARADEAPGLALFIHGNPFEELGAKKGKAGYERFLRQLRALTLAFERPVLVVHGDSHYFRIDKPLMREGTTRDIVENFTRLEVFGSSNMHAVRVDVDPASKTVFQASELIVEENVR